MAKTIKCFLCESNLDKDIIGLNKKLLDENLSHFLCIDCLSAHVDVPAEDLYAKIDDFKEQGCTLFF